MEKLTPKYKRVLIKLSGEALAGKAGHGLDENVITQVVEEIKKIHEMGVEIALVIGAGNFWRGRQGQQMDRSTADHMGMIATVMNALAMMEALERHGMPTRVQSAIAMNAVAEPYVLRRTIRHFEKGRIVIIAGGTGHPYCSTDTAAALRACEIHADILLMAKNVDGVYDSDPKLNPKAVKYDRISYLDIVKKGIKAMDYTAATMCMENDIPALAFALDEKDSLIKAVCGQKIGTLINNK